MCPPKTENQLVFYVNGKRVIDSKIDPETSLLTYLRRRLLLTGSKLGCNEGGCGACTVMLSKYDPLTKQLSHFSANACLMPVCMLHGLAVTTVEGIGSLSKLHPVQERLAKAHGSQCGFCTPGIVMSMYTLLRNNPSPSLEDLESAFGGNLCRCTGYRPIMEGFKTFTKKDNGTCSGNENGTCCQMNSTTNGEQENREESTLFESSKCLPYNSSQEPIFPPELMLDAKVMGSQSLKFVGERVTFLRPATMDELLELKSQYPNAKLLIGNTEIGIEIRFKNMHYPIVISPSSIPELVKVELTESGIEFGAACTLTCIDQTLKSYIDKLPEWKTRVFSAIVEMIKWFAGHQVRNVASIGGNIMTGSPISDLNPLLMAAGTILSLKSNKAGKRTVVMDHTFFTGYRKNIVNPEEILTSIHLPFTREDEYFFGYKQSPRRDDDIAIVNAGMRVMFENGIVKEAALCYGGMAPTTVMAKNTANALIGRVWNEEIFTDVFNSLAEDLPLSPDAPGGMVDYRRTLTTSFFFKFYFAVLNKLHQKTNISLPEISQKNKSVVDVFHRDPTCGTQCYQVVDNQPVSDSVGRPIVHSSALKQATGEAVYCDDMPLLQGELYAAMVVSKKAHAEILGIDARDALLLPGVHSFINHKDIPPNGSNITGLMEKDEEIFASHKVTCVGQLIGLTLADSREVAQRAAKMVCVDYKELEPVITIEDAIRRESYYKFPELHIEKGNIDQTLDNSDQIVEGEMRVGGQEHFYLETQACICVPKEDGEMEIFASTQSANTTQEWVANALGVPFNKVVCRVKRLGGAFGGKESRGCWISAACAVATKKAGRSVRCMLERDEDMCTTGTRHPFLVKYKVGFTNKGVIQALDLQLYNNAGNSLDMSSSVMIKALLASDNSYKIPNIRARGYLCKTNLPSNTAFRGFGAPQAMIVTESWLTRIAVECGISQRKVREINMYKDHDITYFNQELYPCTIERCWTECLRKSEFEKKELEANAFNKKNRWKKRGLAIIPTKFGIAFEEALHLNQGGALVHIYTDSSVLVTHGGVEMGQGLHTKMIQVASRELGVPIDKVHISETRTDTVPNTTSTAASLSSDLYGEAVKAACELLIEKLKPYTQNNPKGKWEDWVNAAYMDRVSLSATGFYKTPDIGYDWHTKTGRPYNYFCYGAACSEVEIDCLTGDHKVLRTDIVMDVGKSINPAIDIGQVEGGFIQGYGLFTLEDHRWSPKGELLTRGPGMYKIPGFNDIPVEFNVSLLTDSKNPRAIYSSKAIGEPPLFLAGSVFFAIKAAIMAAREEVGIKEEFRFDSPATAERIRMACTDQFTSQFPAAAVGSYQPWYVRV